jgi:hypothetical protein
MFPLGTWVLRVPGNKKERRYISLRRNSTSISAYVARVNCYYKQFLKWPVKENLDVLIPPEEPRTYSSEREALLAGERIKYKYSRTKKEEPTVRLVLDFTLLVRKPRWLFDEDDAFPIQIAGVDYALATFRLDAPTSSLDMKSKLQHHGLWEPMLRGELRGLFWTKQFKHYSGNTGIRIIWSHLRPASWPLKQWAHDNWEALV